MSTLWMNLGIIIVIFSLILYFWQEVLKNDIWSWHQVLNMETAVSIVLFVGITFLVVAFIERNREKKTRK